MANKPTLPIPRDKIGESFVWRDWFQRLSDKVYGSLASQNADNVAITGGTISNINFNNVAITNSTVNSTAIGAVTPSTGNFTSISLNTPLSASYGGTGVKVATANYVFAGPTSGSAVAPTFRALVTSDIPSLPYAPTTSGTSILYGNGSGGFSNVTIGSGISFAAGTLSATGSGGTVTAVTATSPIASTGGTTPNISLSSAYGDTTNPYASKTANYVLAAPNGSAGVPTFRALVAADIPSLSYVTSVSGTSGRITSTGGTTPVIDLASGIATAGTTGSSTLIPVVTIDTYGRVTSITTAANPQGTVTSVSGTAPVVSSGGTTPAISMAAATASVNGYLTSTDWNTFNNKGSGTVTSVTGTAPVVSSGGTTPAISMAAATTSVSGYLTSTDWNTFNNKQPAGSYLTAVTADAPLSGSGTSGSHLVISQATTSTNGYLSSTDWNTFNGKQAAGTYVTSLTVTSANGFAGSFTSGATPALTVSTSITGLLKGNGTAISAAGANTDYVPLSTVLTKTADYTIANTDMWIINNKTGSALTLTFPAASSWTGRSITVKNMQAQLVNSATSNVVPIDSTTAGTAILLAVVGNWATLVSDGTNWVIMQAASNNNLLLE
ncbi:hypothetical protein UFOVP133_55 [uncultured Caudovirales phage]|uniref:Bacteriophage lambda, Stf, side tail fibre-repeat-2 n=1 Tax=uncultured Caudovirales phage TaxID=2100421 RepID=A0A6J5LD15_9CAUD|nr:hypothetical protein UFOVP133_55 [uncultured Caudovirales phage]